MRGVFAIGLVAGLLTGCVTFRDDDGRRHAGYYVMTKGGFNESLRVELMPDGRYVLDHELFMCVIGPDGELPVHYARGEGRWRFETGLILLQPEARTEGFPDAMVFVPALAHRLWPQRQGFTRLLVNAGIPGVLVLTKTTKPAGRE